MRSDTSPFPSESLYSIEKLSALMSEQRSQISFPLKIHLYLPLEDLILPVFIFNEIKKY